MKYRIHEDQSAARENYPDCTPEVCREISRDLHKLCKDHQYPYDHPILVCDDDGNCCICYCRGVGDDPA